jgi:hypothetical protein
MHPLAPSARLTHGLSGIAHWLFDLVPAPPGFPQMNLRFKGRRPPGTTASQHKNRCLLVAIQSTKHMPAVHVIRSVK